MHEDQILNILDSLTLNSLSYDEKAIIVADIKFETSNKRFSNNMTKIVLQKVNDLKNELVLLEKERTGFVRNLSDEKIVHQFIEGRNHNTYKRKRTSLTGSPFY